MTSPDYCLTNDPWHDLVDIRCYTLKQWGHQQSEKYLSGLQRTIKLLSENPMMGKKRPDIAPDVIGFPHASHIIYYVVNQRQIVVFGVLHQSMAPNLHLKNRDTVL